MSFLQQALSPFIGRKSRKKSSEPKKEEPLTYPYYPEPVVQYRREHSPLTALFPQQPLYEDRLSCTTNSSSIRGWQTPNGSFPSRPISPTCSNQSSQWTVEGNGATTPVPPPIPSPPPPSFHQDLKEGVIPRSPTPPFMHRGSNSSTPCVTPAPSVMPLAKIPYRATVSPSPDRFPSYQKKERRSMSKPPPSPSPSTRSIAVQTPVFGRKINLPGGATPVLGRRGVVGIVKAPMSNRDSSYSQCSLQTCPEYNKQRETTTSLFRALSLTPKVKRRKKFSSNYDKKCTNSSITGMSQSNVSSFSFASTGTAELRKSASISKQSDSSSSQSSSSEADGVVRRRAKSAGRSNAVSECSGTSKNNRNVVEIRVGEAGLVPRRRTENFINCDDTLATRVRVSRHQETWHCLPISNSGK